MSEYRQENARALMELRIEQALELADSYGFVVTVEQVPLQPLAMGNYKTVYSIREKR